MGSPGEIDRTEQERGFSRSQFDGGPKDNHSTRPANALRLIHFELFFSERKKNQCRLRFVWVAAGDNARRRRGMWWRNEGGRGERDECGVGPATTAAVR